MKNNGFFRLGTGFTLIELLVVVAIIAILAAIAVPNFMEAQVRAKVSRAKTDMRSMATAIGAYTVDYNNPPLGLAARRALNKVTGAIYEPSAFLKGLTSPVAYMSKLCRDPFIINGYRTGSNSYEYRGTSGGSDFCVYQYDSMAPITAYPGATQTARVLVDSDTYWSTQSWSALYDIFRRGHKWYLLSAGPEKIREGGYNYIGTFGTVNVVYDSTNGTRSKGNIIRTSRGMIPVEPMILVNFNNGGGGSPYRDKISACWYDGSGNVAAPDNGWR